MRKVGFEVQIRPRLLLVTYTSSKKKKKFYVSKKSLLSEDREFHVFYVSTKILPYGPIWTIRKRFIDAQ